ncbi:transposase [Prosthecobacter sp.]|uniref:transposase n=1 Tax=Prosthecobacter sp. TaxID=1965333 RepID=UPI003784D19E
MQEDLAGRKTPAQGVLPTHDGATLLWCTVCADQRGGWCAQEKVKTLLQELWSAPTNAWLVGDFLLMPDHLHFFATPKEGRGPWVDVERWTSFWKDRFSKCCGNPAWRWQRGLFHHRLRSERDYVDKGLYMRHNPVRAGLVDAPDAWPWTGRIETIRW